MTKDHSAEVLHQHDVAAALVLLRVEQPPPVGRDRETGHPGERLFLPPRQRRYAARGKAEEFDRRRGVLLARDEIDARLTDGPITPARGVDEFRQLLFRAAF